MSDAVRRSVAGLWARVKALEARVEAIEAAGLASGAAEAGGDPADGSAPAEASVGRLRRPSPAADSIADCGDQTSGPGASHVSPNPEPRERSDRDERSEKEASQAVWHAEVDNEP